MCKRLSLIFLIYIPIFLLFSGFLETTAGLNQKGNKEFQKKHYGTALETYRKAQIKSPENPDIRYNLGTTLYQLDQFQDAERELQDALTNAKTKELKASAWYNYGNTQYRLGQFEKAEEAYRKALDLNPTDKDAKYNLELLQKKKKIFELKQEKRDQEREQKPPPSSREQQQQQQGGGGKDQKEKQSQNQQDQEQNQGQGEAPRDQTQEQKEQPEQQKEQQEPGQAEPASQIEGKENKQNTQEQPKPSEQIPLAPVKLEPGEEQELKEPKENQEGEELKPLYQGQMSKENALRILDALRDSERELQLLRRPRPQTEREPLRDW